MKRECTKDGFEITFGVNHLGHYLLANLMLKQMVDNGRIVFVSSDMHKPPKLFLPHTPVFTSAKPLAYPEKEASSMLFYPMSKLCNILCVREMAARLAAKTDKHITVNAFNPGLMTDTNFIPSSSNKVARAILTGFTKTFAAAIGRLGNSKTSGKALAALITESQYEHDTGKYFDRGKDVKSSEPSYGKTAARNLWIESAELVGLQQDESILSVT